MQYYTKMICRLLRCSETFVRGDICRVSARQRVFPSSVTSRASGIVAMGMRMCYGFSRVAILTQEYVIPEIWVICLCKCVHLYIFVFYLQHNNIMRERERECVKVCESKRERERERERERDHKSTKHMM